MVAVPKSVGHGDGKYYKPFGGEPFKMGKATNGYQVCSLYQCYYCIVNNIIFNKGIHVRPLIQQRHEELLDQ